MPNISPIIPNCNCPQCCNRETASYNGVKIDIKNPTVNIPPAYTQPIYDIPQTSIYEPQQPQVTETKAEEIK